MLQENKDMAPTPREVPPLGIFIIVAIIVLADIFIFSCVYGQMSSFDAGIAVSLATPIVLSLGIRWYSKSKKTTVLLFYHAMVWVVTVFLAFNLRDDYEEAQLEKYGRRYDATVIELYQERSGRFPVTRYKAKIQYKVKGVYYVVPIKNRRRELQVNDTARIVYSTEDPKIFRLESIAKQSATKEPGYESVSGNASVNNPVVSSIDRLPQFKGGADAFYSYVQENLVYPQVGVVARREGKVMLSFIIDSDGAVKDVQVVDGMGGGYDEAAVKVLENCPNWLPGIQNGKAVRVKYNIPISFAL